MAKPRIPNQRKANIEHKKRTERYAQLIKMIYDRVAQEAARLASIAGSDPSKPFSFDDYPLTREAVKRLQSQFNSDVYAVIMAGTSEEWKESNLVQNLVANKVLTAYVGTDRNGEEYTRYYQTNPDALKAFQQRREGGMNLSDRVWNLSEQYRVELEDAISVAIAPGVSAQQLSLDVRKYLNEPDLMFRRFRYKDESGRWKRKWKKRYTDAEGNVRFMDCDRDSYKNQWTGPGYYKSSAKNAMRLARTEINMAYRTAEQKRWEQFDFVVGYEVKTTQNGKHLEDICDQLAGKYPKDFKFTGWHPQCYDELSEVLTRQGWRRFKNVVDSDEILSLNPETRELEWVSIVDRQCYDHAGDMIHFFNRSLDCLVTPEHRMVYLNKSNGEIRYCQAEDYTQEMGSFIQKEGESNVTSLSSFKKEVEQYSGKVYDLTLERNHIMYIRRNGKCFWGSNCMCYCIPILKTEDEFWAYDPENPQKSANEITELPPDFRKWINDNKERIKAAEKRGKLPYFIRDNREDVENILNPKERKKTPLEIAVERHAARTLEDENRIQNAWNKKLMHDLLNQSDRIGSYHDKEFRELAKLLEDDSALMDFDAFKLDYQLAKKYLRDKIDADTALVGEFLKNKANVENMKELAKALGVEYKDPMTFFEANELRGNPNYKSSPIYRINCQTCVVAHELRRRGFNVQALGNTKGSWLEKLSKKTNTIWLDNNGQIPEKQIVGAHYVKKYSNYHGREVWQWEKTAVNRKQLVKQLESAIVENGRYHIDWFWNGEGRTLSGHIICLEKIDGVIRYYDPQSGKVIGDFYSYIEKIKLDRGIKILRVDNLRINPDYAGHILTKAGAGSTNGNVATSGITGSAKSQKSKAAKQNALDWVESLSQKVQPNGSVSYQEKVGNITVIGKTFINETFAKNIRSNNIEEIMELATHAKDWIPNATLTSIEEGRHHPYKFKVYEVEYDGKLIEFKTKDIEGEPIYVMRIKKN